MRCSNDQATCAYEVAYVAEDLGPVRRIVWNSATVLQVLGVAEQNSSGDLVTDGRVEVLDGGSCKCSTLAVTAGDQSRVGALGVGLLEETEHLPDCSARGSAGEGIIPKSGSVGTANALDPDTILAEGGLKIGGDARTESSLMYV